MVSCCFTQIVPILPYSLFASPDDVFTVQVLARRSYHIPAMGHSRITIFTAISMFKLLHSLYFLGLKLPYSRHVPRLNEHVPCLNDHFTSISKHATSSQLPYLYATQTTIPSDSHPVMWYFMFQWPTLEMSFDEWTWTC